MKRDRFWLTEADCEPRKTLHDRFVLWAETMRRSRLRPRLGERCLATAQGPSGRVESAAMRASGAVLLLFASTWLGALAFTGTSAAADQFLILERTIPLDNVAGRIDHMAIDLVHGRLFVAELGNDSVDVVDIENGKVVRRISDLKEPQGLAYLPGQDLVVVASVERSSCGQEQSIPSGLARSLGMV